MRKRAAILTIGTEITDGQILNSNSQWLAAQISELQADVLLHMSVADDFDQMIRALDHCSCDVDAIFISGGLGPTRDDFTRDVVSKWLDKPLVLDEGNWQAVQDRLTKLGVNVAAANKQQCYFPRGAHIWNNPAGTAAAFHVEKEKQLVVCLPGPPQEIFAVWDTGLRKFLQERWQQDSSKKLLFKWQCLGVSESRLGEIVEEVLAGSGLVTGYRPHIPYVEIKIWVSEEKLGAAQPYLKKLDATLAECVVCRDGEDVAELLANKLEKYQPVLFVDRISAGHIGQRFGMLENNVTIDVLNSRSANSQVNETAYNLVVELAPDTNDQRRWNLKARGKNIDPLTIPLQYNRVIQPNMRSRFYLYVCELSLATLHNHLP